MNNNLLLIGTLLAWGCGPAQRTPIDAAIANYANMAGSVHLGDSVASVRKILDPTQLGLPLNGRKPSEGFIRDGSFVEILYYRSMRQPDGITTDDEFTPYVFRDDRLIAIGWTALGGPKSHARSAPERSEARTAMSPTLMPVVKGRWHLVEAVANDEVFVIDGKVFKAQTYCFNVMSGDTVMFVDGNPLACASASFLVERTGRVCKVWCE